MKRNTHTSESGTIHSGALFTILQAHWKPVDGLFDAGCGSGVVIALASMWASIHNNIFPADEPNEEFGIMRGVEISPQSLLRSTLLATCGDFVAQLGKLKWPRKEFVLSDLKTETSWKTDIKFALLNNCKFGEETEINQNALKYLCEKKTKLVCFQFSAFPFQAHCITCLQKIENFGQWEGSSNVGYVLENCVHHFKPISMICDAEIKAWLTNIEQEQTQIQMKSTHFFNKEVVETLVKV